MPRFFWILILVASLGGLCPLETVAKPKPKHKPQPAPVTHLTDHEQGCYLLGTLAHAVTIDRNNSVSLLTTLDRLRSILQAAPELLAPVERLTVLIYSDTRRLTSPGQVRQAAELGCLFPETEKGPTTWERR